MTGRPRALPAAMALDAVGHALYARVTGLKDFTMARAELDIIQTHRREILALAGGPREIVDLRAGSATQPRPLLSEVDRYVAIETCRAVLDDAIDGLAAAFPHLVLRGIVGEPRPGLVGAPLESTNRLVLLLEGALGRYDATMARIELTRIRSLMEPSDRLLIGMDLAKDDVCLGDGYQDSCDVFGAYMRNAMRRTNREIGTDFRSSDWLLVVEPQSSQGRVEIRFEARCPVTVNGGRTGERWTFERGETLIVEHAYKHSEGQVAAMAVGAGFGVSKVWRDCAQGYALFLLAP